MTKLTPTPQFLHTADLAIIIALTLPIDQAVDFLIWVVSGIDYVDIVTAPGWNWYTSQHAGEITRECLRREP